MQAGLAEVEEQFCYPVEAVEVPAVVDGTVVAEGAGSVVGAEEVDHGHHKV